MNDFESREIVCIKCIGDPTQASEVTRIYRPVYRKNR